MRPMRAKGSRVPVGAEEGRGDAGSGGLRLGQIVAVDQNRHILVEFDGSAGPTVARLAIAVDKRRLDRAIAEREATVLGFEDGDPRRPIVLGLVPLPATRALTAPTPANTPGAPPARAVIQAD